MKRSNIAGVVLGCLFGLSSVAIAQDRMECEAAAEKFVELCIDNCQKNIPQAGAHCKKGCDMQKGRVYKECMKPDDEGDEGGEE